MIYNDIIIPDSRYLPLISKCINNLYTWGFAFDYAAINWDIDKMEPLGLTKWENQNGYLKITIVLNQGLITQDKNVVLDTIYHELAHVIAGPGVQHGQKWLDIVSIIRTKTGLPMRVKATEDETDDQYYLIGYKYAIMCEKCGKIVGFNKKVPVVINPKMIDPKSNSYRFFHADCGGLWRRIK